MVEEKVKYEEVIALLDEGDIEGATSLISSLHPADIAEMLRGLAEASRLAVFRRLETVLASEVMAELDESTREEILTALDADSLADIADEMESDEATDLVESVAEVSDKLARDVLDHMDEGRSSKVRSLLQYEEETAGALMQTEFFSVDEDATAQEALAQLRAFAGDVEVIHNIFVVDKTERLVGNLHLYKLVLADLDERMGGLVGPEVVKVPVDLDQEEVARVFEKYDLVSLPVVDRDRHVLGRITIDDIVDVIEDEASEDLFRMAGLKEDERIFGKPMRSIRKRLPWLWVYLMTSLISALVIAMFQDTIRAFVVLAVFMPIVAGVGGSAGTQTVAIMVRGIALGELSFKDARRALVRQFMVGAVIAVALGGFIAVVAFLWKRDPALGLVLCVAMIANILVAILLGTLVPLTLKRLKADPALASGVFVTTSTDAFGFLSFLGLATIFMKYLHG